MDQGQQIERLPSGFAYPVGPDDRLEVTIINGDAADTITLTYVIHRKDGLHIENVPIACASNSLGGAATTFSTPMTDGFLVGASFRSAASHQLGTVYCRLLLARYINATTTQPYAILIRDFVAFQYQPTWPPINDRGYGPSREVVKNLILTVPAVGVDVNYTVPAFQRFTIVGIRVQITTDATVANRYIIFAISQNGAEILHLNSAIPTPAGTTKDYFFLAGYPRTDNFIPAQVIEPLPTGIVVASSALITTGVSGLQAGDQITRFNVSCLFTTTAA